MSKRTTEMLTTLGAAMLLGACAPSTGSAPEGEPEAESPTLIAAEPVGGAGAIEIPAGPAAGGPSAPLGGPSGSTSGPSPSPTAPSGGGSEPPSAGTAAPSGSPSPGTAFPSPPSPSPSSPSAALPPCVASPSEVVILGDSYVTGAVSPALQPTLAALEPSASQFRNYAVAGTSMATGGITGFIPPQLDLAKGLGKIRLAIMDGGGNDILLCDGLKFPGCGSVCNTAGSSSQKVCTDIVTQAIATMKSLLQKAADAGVSDVIYFFYPHVPSNFGGYKEMIDYAEPLFQDVCDGMAADTGGKLLCHFVDLVQPFAAAGGDINPLNFSIDGIHPSMSGQTIMAQEIYDVMKASCLGQPASSGCCAP